MKNAIFFVLLITIGCKNSYQLKETKNTQYLFSDSTNTAIDSSYYRFLTPYREKMEKEMNEILGSSETTLEKGLPESKLGNFVADACLEIATANYHPSDELRIDFSFFNSGGLRKSLPSGTITRGDIFQLMPFENELVILYCNGDDVEKLVNFIASKGGGPVGGIRFSIENGKPKNILIGNLPFDHQKKYKVLTSDYLANGGDNFSFLSELKRDDLNLKVRDALIRYVKQRGDQHQPLNIKTDGRIINVK